MSGVLDLQRITLKGVAERLGVHITTVWRWTLYGVRGRRLASHMVGGRRYVLLRDLEEFIGGRDTSDTDQPEGQDHRMRARAASKLLDARGIKPR